MILKREREAVAIGIRNTEAHLKKLRDRLDALDEAINSLGPFYSEREAGTTQGITDAVRSVYRSSDQYFAPTDIRDALRNQGLLKGYDNEMAVIHQVIRRLEEQGQLQRHGTEKWHRWKPFVHVAGATTISELVGPLPMGSGKGEK